MIFRVQLLIYQRVINSSNDPRGPVENVSQMRRRIRGPAAKGSLRARLRIWEPRVASGACESRRGNMGVFVNFHEFSCQKKTEIAVELVIEGKFWKMLRKFELNLRGNLAEDLGFRHHREVFSPLCSPHFHSQLILGRSYSTILDMATVRGFKNGGYQARTYVVFTYIATPKR